MSTMLEQAIIDASALREAAIKNAEQAVVAKFSDQIKETVENLLEQDPSEEEASTLDEAEVPETVTEDVSEDVYGGEEVAPEDEDEKTKVEEQLDDVGGKAYAFADGIDNDGFELGEDELIEIDLEKIIKEEDTLDISEESLEEVVKEENSSEEAEKAEQISEKVTFQHNGEQRTGWMATPSSHRFEAKMVDEILAAIELYNQELEEQNKDLQKENKELKKIVSEKEKKNKSFAEDNKKLLETINTVKEKFDEVQLINVKLLYTNKVLMDTSLNERQKNEIVESINHVDSMESAKLVYETLQSAVGSFKKKDSKSLSEVVSRRSSTSVLLKSHKNGTHNIDKQNDGLTNRMKKLAGIK